ncbi:hypothetical protein [Methylosinus sp. Sm6]|uniref:hypothetical protein n=1 Tax=Methylosinus sp. Sm6 TaxID=2866948 RepID=UPI001C991EE0|nr:hypothetical protein [Methylosinus sp. Sm6]MBY6243948.1 hypothetical protein [Methylosinus sp. Sm6]
MINTEKKASLMANLLALGLSPDHVGCVPPLPLVSLEEFFEGNDDQESIAVNLLSNDPALNAHPGIQFLFNSLKSIRSRPDVKDIRVEIFDIEPALQYEDTWPFAEKVFFLTSASASDVGSWASMLHASGAVQGYDRGWHANPLIPKGDSGVWRIIWD